LRAWSQAPSAPSRSAAARKPMAWSKATSSSCSAVAPVAWRASRAAADWIFNPGLCIIWKASSKIRAIKSGVSSSSLGRIDSYFVSREEIIFAISLLILSSRGSG
jgi:hypothetical protein